MEAPLVVVEMRACSPWQAELAVLLIQQIQPIRAGVAVTSCFLAVLAVIQSQEQAVKVAALISRPAQAELAEQVVALRALSAFV